MQTEEGRKDFKCRICGCNEYQEVLKNNGIIGPGGYSWVAYRICKGCSVLFLNPEKFSQK